MTKSLSMQFHFAGPAAIDGCLWVSKESSFADTNL